MDHNPDDAPWPAEHQELRDAIDYALPSLFGCQLDLERGGPLLPEDPTLSDYV